jgi:hypothetical protein
MLEAKLYLTALDVRATTVTMQKQALPVGKVGPTPAEPCCKGPKHRCAVQPALWDDPIWTTLHMRIEDPGWFQYSYESTDGKTATATAVGDPDCDGTSITFKLELAIGADGKLSSKLTEPTPEDD